VTFIIAEAGVNHNGDIGQAFLLCNAAKEAGADFVKLQTRTPELAVPQAEWHEFRDTPWGQLTKLDYRRRVEFTDQQVEAFRAGCAEIGLPWFSSVWDVPALERLHRLMGDQMHAVKIPSARNKDRALIMAAAGYGVPLILSTGMSSMDDVAQALHVFHGLAELSAGVDPLHRFGVLALNFLRPARGCQRHECPRV